MNTENIMLRVEALVDIIKKETNNNFGLTIIISSQDKCMDIHDISRNPIKLAKHTYALQAGLQSYLSNNFDKDVALNLLREIGLETITGIDNAN